MRKLAYLVPIVPVLGVVLWLATRSRIVLGAFLIGHALIHLGYLSREPPQKPGAPTWPFHLDRSWALSGLGLGTAAVRAVGVVLAIVTVVGFGAAGIAALGNQGWWAGPAVVSAVASAVLLALYFDAMLVLGLIIDAFVLSAAAFGWPAVAPMGS
jgi:hypothetical protein